MATPAWIIDDIFRKAGPPAVRAARNIVRKVVSKENQLATAQLQLQRRSRNSALNAIKRAEERAVRVEARTGKKLSSSKNTTYAKQLIGKTQGTRVQRAAETEKRLRRELEDVRSQAKALFPKESDFKTALSQERRLVEKGWSQSKRANAAQKPMKVGATKKTPAKKAPAKKAPAKKGTVVSGPVKKKVPQQYLKKS
jgi:hypothetical protein